MNLSAARLRQILFAAFAAFAATAAGGAWVAALTVPSATAASDPCAASEVAKTIGTVANNTGSYLDTHPETNDTLTTISKQQGGPASLAAVKSYFDANPQVAADMQKLQQPLVNLSGRCRLPVTIPQVLGLMQAAQPQGGGGLPGSLPGSLPGAQNASAPGVLAPAQSSPVSATSPRTGPLPGPAPSSYR
jgi:hemophore